MDKTRHLSKVTAGLVILAGWCLVPAFRHHRQALLDSLARFNTMQVLRPASQWALTLSKPSLLIALALLATILIGTVEFTVRNERARFVIQIAVLLVSFTLAVFVFNGLFWLGDPVNVK